MGLVGFQDKRVGFWIAERSQDPLGEVPAGLAPQVVGERTAETRALVLCAIGEGDVPAWAVVLHSAIGAALVVPWGDRLVAGLGGTALFLEPTGRISGTFQVDDELAGAATVGEAILFVARRQAACVERSGAVRWTVPLGGDGTAVLEAGPQHVRLVTFEGADWREVVLDAATGAQRP